MVESKAELTDRWRREGREEEVARFRQQVRDACRAQRVSREEAHEAAWAEAARNFPPLQPPKPPTAPASEAAARSTSSQADSGRVQGLADIPTGWPELPANASLAREIGWVQAERLRIVEELPTGGTRVRLERARAPAPSWSALSWLETSIRSYAKFVEVAAKVASAPDDEQSQVKRERMRIEEIKALLAEMRR